MAVLTSSLLVSLLVIVNQAAFLSSQSATTLKEAAEGTGIYIGTAINYNALNEDQQYYDEAIKEYSLMTSENGCKMNAIAKDYDTYDFTRCDYLIAFAKDNNLAMRSHNLIWGSPGYHNPEFIRAQTNATKLQEFMIEYITTVMTRQSYDQPFAYDVVNEAVSNSADQFIKTSPWSAIDDYICKAFKAARAANPSVQLFYNDYKHASMTGIYKTKSDKVYKLISEMVANDCPIDGVGFQNHIDINYDSENYDSIRENIQRYAKIGIKVHITETDVRCNQFQTCTITEWTEEELATQASIYANLLQICLEEPNCYNFETWGYTDKYSSLDPPQDGLVFDREFNKKPAYTALLSTLNNFSSDHPAAIERRIRKGEIY